MDKMYIYIGVGVLVVVVIIALVLILKKKKSKNSGEPIHKDYDSSIANMVNNEPVKGGTFIPNEPVNPNAAPMPMPSVVEPEIDANGPDMTMNQPMPPMAPNPMGMQTAPALEVPNPMAPNPMQVPTGPELVMPTPMAPNPMETPAGPELIMPNAMETPNLVAPAPMAAQPATVDPIMPNLSAPIMPSLTDTPAVPETPVAETPQPVAAPIMPDLMAAPVETTPVAPMMETAQPAAAPVAPVMPDLMAPAAPTMEAPQPAVGVVPPVDTTTPPVDLMAPPVDLMAPPTNVGMVAEPLIEQQPVAPVAPAVVEEPKFNVEIPVVDTPPMPEVAQTAAAPVMQNTEIPGPTDNLTDTISGVTPAQPKKEPMFVFDMPEETKSTAPLHQEIEVDVPDMEEMV